MKIIDQKGRLFGLVNIIDISVLLIILLVFANMASSFIKIRYNKTIAVKFSEPPVVNIVKHYYLLNRETGRLMEHDITSQSPYFKLKRDYPEEFDKRYILLEQK